MSSVNSIAPSLTVIIPAYKEASELYETYETVVRTLQIAGISDYEIFLMTVKAGADDNDDTLLIVDKITNENPKVRHFPTKFFAGPGFKYREGVYAATKEYVMWVPNHNLTEESSLVNIMLHIGLADAIFTYTGNPEARSAEVRFVSRAYVALCNILFGLNLKYYNGISIIRRDLLLQIPMSADDHSFLTEVIVYLIKAGVKYLEIPQFLKPSKRTVRAWTPDNSLKVLGSLSSLFWKIYINEEQTKIPENVSSSDTRSGLPNLVLPDSSGAPDLTSVFRFLRQGFTQTIHPTIVYLARCGAKSLGLDKMSKDGHEFNPDKILGVAKTLIALTSKIGMRMVVSGIASATLQKRSRRATRKKKGASLSIVMLAYNEAQRLPNTYQSIIRVLEKSGVKDYEIIIVSNSSPEGTNDGTLAVADSIAKNDERVSHIPNKTYAGMGVRFRNGVEAAKNSYVMMVPGDGEFDEEATAEVIAQIGKSEVIIPYIANPNARTQDRQIVSRTFTSICNTFFGLRLNYFNGPCIIRTDYVKATPFACQGYAYMAEILIYLIKSGANYREVPWKIKPVVGSKAFKAESINEVLESLVSLFWKINVEGTRVDLPN